MMPESASHPTAECDLCSKPFVKDEGWKRKCVLCWKKEKGYEIGVGDKAFEALQEAYGSDMEKAKAGVEVQLADTVDMLRQAVATTEALQARLAKAMTANKDLKNEVEKLRKELARVALEAKQRKPEPATGGKKELSPARVKQLIRLCHPDKHGGSELANEITKWLLSKREESP